MARQVWKYCLVLVKEGQRLEIPNGGRVLHLGRQGLGLCLWVEVDIAKKPESRKFKVIGAGQDCPEDINDVEYLGTVVMDPQTAMSFVWHVYEVGIK